MTENIIAHLIDDKRTKDVLVEDDVSFQTMFLSSKCLEGLTKCGFQKPSPIQLKAIPLGRCGFDLIVKSKSGTGKTIVFSVVALEMIDLSSSNLQVLVLAPTREIAVQSAGTMRAIGSSFTGLVVDSFIGGLPEKDDKDKAQNCQIAVGAPGRIKSLIKQNILNVDSVKLFVLDEADKLMESSFQDDVNEIYHCLPLKKQIIAASATYPDNLGNFLSKYMQSPTYVSSENNTQLLLGLKHFIKEVESSSNSVQEMKAKNEELLKLLTNISFTQCIIFSNYQTRAENISISINRDGWNSMFISAAQPQQKRLEVIDKLKNFKCRILLSTDLTARGLDVSNVDLVINYDMPIDVSTYLHRMGRAGRYGSKGVCISLVSGEKDLLQMRKFLGNIGGANLTISKLKDVENGVNLWEDDESKFEKISGIIDKNEDVTHTIKNEVLSLKHSEELLEEQTEKIKKKKKKNNDSQTKADNENASLKQDDNLTDAKLQCGNDLIKKNVVNNECLKSLTTGTYDFRSIPNPSNKSVGEMNESPDRDDTEQNNSNKNNYSIEKNLDSNTLLKLLAEGTFDFQNIPSCAIGALDNKDNEAKLASIMKQEDDSVTVKNKNHSIIQDVLETLAGGDNYDEFEKNEKTRKSSELQTENKGKICKNEIYLKNKGRYEVARMLNNTNTNLEMETNICNYLNILEQPIQTNELISQENTVQQNLTIESDRDNIFSHAYLHNIEKTKNHWKSLLKDVEISTIEQKNIEECEQSNQMEEDHEGETEEYYDEEMEVNYEEDSPNIEYDENGYENIPNRMVWLPVEESSSEKNEKISQINSLEEESCGNTSSGPINEAIMNVRYPKCFSRSDPFAQIAQEQNHMHLHGHLLECFHECSNELWVKGLSCNSPEDFVEWYTNDWTRKLEKTREYVRQNIYVEEMKCHQNNMGKF